MKTKIRLREVANSVYDFLDTHEQAFQRITTALVFIFISGHFGFVLSKEIVGTLFSRNILPDVLPESIIARCVKLTHFYLSFGSGYVGFCAATLFFKRRKLVARLGLSPKHFPGIILDYLWALSLALGFPFLCFVLIFPVPAFGYQFGLQFGSLTARFSLIFGLLLGCEVARRLQHFIWNEKRFLSPRGDHKNDLLDELKEVRSIFLEPASPTGEKVNSSP